MDIQFPTRIINGCKRHFQSSWLSKYNGLVYSESADGGFCKYCVVCANVANCKVKELGVLVKKPLTNFKKATEKLDEHFHVNSSIKQQWRLQCCLSKYRKTNHFL